MTVEMQVPAWNRHKNVVGLNKLIGYQTTVHFLIIGSPMTMQMINK
jgi:hypothetical protein